MARQDIFNEIDAERVYQTSRWGAVGDAQAFDTANTVNDWAAWLGVYTAKATAMGATVVEQRKALLKVAAIAVAALENYDANNGFPARHFERSRT